MTLESKLKKAIDSNDEKTIHNIFSEIYLYYGKLIYFIISKSIENKEDVEDLTQDCFVNFFNNINKTSINNIKYYLVKTANNLVINHLRKQNKEVVLNELITYKEEKIYNDEYDSIINKMKKYLNEFEINIILKHVVYGLKFKEIANEYNMSINTVFAIYNRAIKKIRKGENKNEKQ